MGPLRFDPVAVVETLKSNQIFFRFQKTLKHVLIKASCCEGTRVSSCIFSSVQINTNLQKIEPTKPNRGRDGERERGERDKEFHHKVYPNTASTLPQFCQLADWSYCMGLSTQLIFMLPKKNKNKKIGYSTENGTKEKWRGQCALSGGTGSYVGFLFFGIHVTALLKNASKQLQDSWDWIWAHKVVTIIQTSAVWTEGSRRLQRRVWNALACHLIIKASTVPERANTIL